MFQLWLVVKETKPQSPSLCNHQHYVLQARSPHSDFLLHILFFGSWLKIWNYLFRHQWSVILSFLAFGRSSHLDLPADISYRIISCLLPTNFAILQLFQGTFHDLFTSTTSPTEAWFFTPNFKSRKGKFTSTTPRQKKTSLFSPLRQVDCLALVPRLPSFSPTLTLSHPLVQAGRVLLCWKATIFIHTLFCKTSVPEKA